MRYLIAGCVFASRFPALSLRIWNYVRDRHGLRVVRCCVGNYKVREFTEKMPPGEMRSLWSDLPETGIFRPGDQVYSLCHNCSNILEEVHPDVQVSSLWELIDQDAFFPFPSYNTLCVTLQDCWRARDRKTEQEAVRSLLGKMKITYLETEENREKTEFCGASLYRPQPPRNPILAPRHYRDGAVGKFIPLSSEEQERKMKEHAARFSTKKVVCYCHYCLEGLEIGGVDGRHIAQLLFP